LAARPGLGFGVAPRARAKVATGRVVASSQIGLRSFSAPDIEKLVRGVRQKPSLQELLAAGKVAATVSATGTGEGQVPMAGKTRDESDMMFTSFKTSPLSAARVGPRPLGARHAKSMREMRTPGLREMPSMRETGGSRLRGEVTTWETASKDSSESLPGAVTSSSSLSGSATQQQQYQQHMNSEGWDAARELDLSLILTPKPTRPQEVTRSISSAPTVRPADAQSSSAGTGSAYSTLRDTLDAQGSSAASTTASAESTGIQGLASKTDKKTGKNESARTKWQFWRRNRMADPWVASVA
jgi:hypothetical protein